MIYHMKSPVRLAQPFNRILGSAWNLPAHRSGHRETGIQIDIKRAGVDLNPPQLEASPGVLPSTIIPMVKGPGRESAHISRAFV